MSEKIQCPNCGEQAEKTGKKIVCQACDSVFNVTKTGSASVEQIGWKEEMENRVKANEDRLAGLVGGEPEPEPEPSKQDLNEIEDEADEPILPV